MLFARIHDSSLAPDLQQKRHIAAFRTQKKGKGKKTILFEALLGFPLSELLNAAMHLCVPITSVT